MSVTEPRSRCLTPEEATPFYDRLGSGQDWQRLYESFAIRELIGHAAYRPGAVDIRVRVWNGDFPLAYCKDIYPQTHAMWGSISTTLASPAQLRLKPWPGRARVYRSRFSRFRCWCFLPS